MNYTRNLDSQFLPQGQYDVKGKGKPPESVLKVISALFRKYRGMVAILNPLNAEVSSRSLLSLHIFIEMVSKGTSFSAFAAL